MKTRSCRRANGGIWPPIYFAILSFAVWAPALFTGGYVLLGDMVFTPAMNSNAPLLGPPRGLMSIALLLNVAGALSRLIGAVLLQKLLLLSLVFLPGYLMYRNAPTRNRWAAIFAGTLYAVNPFIYTRLMMGHWGLIIGYALLPVAAVSALKTFRVPSPDRAAKAALWLAFITIVSIHMGIIAIILVFFLWVFSFRRPVRVKVLTAAFVAVVVLFALLCSFFIIPALHSGGLVSRIGRIDLKAFETRSTSSAGREVSVLGLYGFWKLRLDPLLPRGYVPLWPVFVAILISLGVFGAVGAWREPSRGSLVKALVVCAVIGFFLALGSVAPLTGRLFLFLYDHLSLVKLFREPQKFAAFLALAYSMLGAIGTERLLDIMSRRPKNKQVWKTVTVALLILLTFFYSFRVFGGLWGQARSVQYPRSWAQAKDILDREADGSRVLFVPPYWYMRFDFTGSNETIASPLPTYFEQRNLVGVAIEVFGSRLDAGPIDRYLDAAYSSAKRSGNLGAMLAPLDVKYVLFVRNAASTQFSYVLGQKDLEVVRRWPDLVLLKNKVQTHRLVLTEHNGHYRKLEEVGPLASGANLIGSFISRGSTTSIPDVSGRPLTGSYSTPNSTSFDIPSDLLPGANLLLAEPYDNDWRMNGRLPRWQLGVTCAFSLVKGDGGKATIEYFNPYLMAGYILSGVGLLLCATLFVVGSIDKRRTATAEEQRGADG